MTIQTITPTVQIVKNADIKVSKLMNEKGHPIAHIEVDGQYEHTFSASSRVSKHLDMMEPKDLESRLQDGTYFFVENELIDFRDGSYSGFVHKDDNIKNFLDVIGYQRKAELNLAHHQKLFNPNEDIIDSPIVLRKIWDKAEIQVPGYASIEGTDFDSVLSFQWNPFVKTVNSMFDLVRQICTNGMVGMTSFLNTKVPLENRWEEHLDIAARQIQNKVDSTIKARVGTMLSTKATLGDCLLLEDHALERLHSVTDAREHEMLLNMVNAISPRVHLSHVYRESLFDDRRVAAQVPGHLTNFGVYNFATQLRTHTNPTKKSSDTALDKFSNYKLFDNDDSYCTANRASKDLAFVDASRAFFGDLIAA